MKKRVPKHPLAIRWMHWINFPVLFVMIWSGMLIYWANDVYKVRVGHNILYSFFPEGFYRTLHLSKRLAEGMAFHFVFMWLFFINGLIYVLYTAFSGQWRHLVPNRHSFKEAWLVLLHDLHLRKRSSPGSGSAQSGAPPQGKFNGAQKIAYTGIIIMGLGSVLTGLAIYKPVQFNWLAFCFGGYATARIIHFILTLLYCLFFVVHVVQVILAGWNNFRAMVTGWEVVKVAETPVPVANASAAPTNASNSLANAASAAPPNTVNPPAPITPLATRRIQKEINRRTFFSFTVFTLLGAAAWKIWFGIKDASQSNGVQKPLRKVLDVDDKIFKPTLSDNHLAKTYSPAEAARNVRTNSNVGSNPHGFDPAAWRLEVQTLDKGVLNITLDDLKQLPKTQFVFEFKCIEGWSQVSWWGGVKFSDFIDHYGLQKEAALEYVGMSTPDDEYYVGIDKASALHPQTILCYEMTGQPLLANHGAPLRLIIPVKYGVKNLKRIGKIHFSNDRPRDYWFERGYDYYCGL
jgi:thiosulfate reductase cytochrome b subunit